MVEQVEKFTIEFFRNLKCDISRDGNFLIVKNVPKSFEDLFGNLAPYKLTFFSGTGGHFVGKGSPMLLAMTKFLEGTGKTTLLKIDFDVEPIKEINSVISLKNCEIANIKKKHKNNFFSRFTFITTFRYMNESEKIVNEIYVHDGKVVKGDLDGYRVIEGEKDKVPSELIKKNYEIARGILKEALDKKTSEIGEILEKKAGEEVVRINQHYDNLLSELGGDLKGQIEKIKETELAIRTASEDEIDAFRARLDRLKNNLIKMGDDDSRDKVLKEKEFTIKDVMHKHSLNIDNKLVNTTVIYYPVFNFNLFLKSHGPSGTDSVGTSGRFVEMTYDPLTKTLNKLHCESCNKEISKINLCSSGHLSCDNCLDKCGECGKSFCKKCLGRNCSSCGKPLCKNCSIMCIGCGKYVCRNHIRKDCVSGDERCVSCLRACLRCHGMATEKYFGEALDGSKVCQKCLGAEKRSKVMDRIFTN